MLDPLARAHETILFDWNWPSALTMYQLLRALNGHKEEFFDEEEDVFDNEDLAIAAELIRSKRDCRYASSEWQWALERVEGYLGQLD